VPLGRPRLGRSRIRLRVGNSLGSGRWRPLLRSRGCRPGSSFPLFLATTRRRDTLTFLGLPLWLSVRRPVGLAVSRSDGDFDLDDLIPLLIGAISLWDGEKFT